MKTTSTSTPKDYIDSDKNMITLFDTDILVEAVNGRLDHSVALNELKNRGLDKDGKGVGFNVK